jgi:hypothetical protein
LASAKDSSQESTYILDYRGRILFSAKDNSQESTYILECREREREREREIISFRTIPMRNSAHKLEYRKRLLHQLQMTARRESPYPLYCKTKKKNCHFSKRWLPEETTHILEDQEVAVSQK